MIIVKKIKSKNIFSIGNNPIEINLDNSQMTLLSGSNGSGKTSTIVDALNIALFNSAYRKVTKSQCINTINATDSFVEVELENGSDVFKIVRGLKPSKFDIYKNGELLDKLPSATLQQEYLEKVVLNGMDEKVFKQCVMMGSAIFVPFMKLSAQQRREFIEDLLDIKIFSSMSTIARKNISDLKAKITHQTSLYNTSIEKMNIHKNTINNLKSNLSEKETEYLDKINTCEGEITTIKERIDEVESELITLVYDKGIKSKLQDSKSKLQTFKTELEVDNRNLSKTIDFFSNNCSCPTCTQDIDEEFKNNIIEESREKFIDNQEKIEKSNDKISAINTKLQEFDDIDRKNVKLSGDIRNYNSNVSVLENKISMYRDSITDNDNSELVKKSLISLKEEKETSDKLKTGIDKLKNDIKYQESINIMLKDDGIKTKIVKKYIPEINRLVNEYLVRFGLPIEFTLDDEFKETVKSRYRDTLGYNSFSEGEKHRIDMALMLAWRDIAKAKNTTNINLLILDEVFDSSLDPVASEEFLNILGEMEESNVYIISHKNDLSDKVDRILEFKKAGNFTVMDEH